MHPMYHPSFVLFLSYFNGNQDYFECHEVLEEYWKDIAPRERKHPLTGWIQLATGMYHWRRGNFKGATTILKKGYATLQASRDTPFVEKIDFDLFMTDYERVIHQTTALTSFQPFMLTVSDDALYELMQKMILEQSPVEEAYILHKHKLRDRSDVIAEREEAIRIRHSLNTKRSRH